MRLRDLLSKKLFSVLAILMVPTGVGAVSAAVANAREASMTVRNSVGELEQQATRLNRDIDDYVAQATG
jgi:hypothetical protein